VPIRSAAGVPRTDAVNPPVRLIVERLDADVPVVPVGVRKDGEMEIPADAARAGWYRFGAAPGAASGTTVIAAHSGSHITRFGPLRNLAESRRGDIVVVEGADGTDLRYVVESAALVPKTTIDLARYFRRDGDHRLVLITCDGTWSQERRSYSDNAVVVARLEN
jgi:LPXTG-site transpeptidase (sortase) family protein